METLNLINQKYEKGYKEEEKENCCELIKKRNVFTKKEKAQERKRR